MAKRVTGKPMLHCEGRFNCVDELIDGKRCHRLIGMLGIGKKIAMRFSVLKPVFRQYDKGIGL